MSTSNSAASDARPATDDPGWRCATCPGLEAHYDARIEAWFAVREAELAAYLGEPYED